MAEIIEIKDFGAKELDVYARYSEAQLKHIYEPEDGLFIAESPKVIERALEGGCIPVSFLVEKPHLQTQAKTIIEGLDNDVKVFTSDFDTLTKLTGYKLTRGMLAVMKRPRLKNIEDVCKNARRIAVLEDVVNPTNVGAIFRSAAALSIDAVILSPGCSDPLYRRSLRVSMGTVFQIPWTFACENEESWKENGVEMLKSLGFKTAAMALKKDTVSIDDKRLSAEEKLAIILGTEGEGLLDSTIDKCDYTIKIPMAHNVDSLNVAAASAVAFWELTKNKMIKTKSTNKTYL